MDPADAVDSDSGPAPSEGSTEPGITTAESDAAGCQEQGTNSRPGLVSAPVGPPVIAFEPPTAAEIREHAVARAERAAARNVTTEARRAMVMRSGSVAARGRAHVSTCTCLECRQRKARARRKPGAPRLQFRMNKSSIRVVMSTLLKQGFSETGKRHWNLMWTSAHLKSYEFQVGPPPRPHPSPQRPHSRRHADGGAPQGLSRFQRVNQFPRSYEITRKDSLCRNISRMQALHGRRCALLGPLCPLPPPLSRRPISPPPHPGTLTSCPRASSSPLISTPCAAPQRRRRGPCGSASPRRPRRGEAFL